MKKSRCTALYLAAENHSGQINMIKFLTTTFLLFTSFFVLGQSIDEPFSSKKMTKDLEVFRNIRQMANSGLYKYRTKDQIDSIYTWANDEIKNLSSYREFYNLICTLTDYEGSLHNNTHNPEKRVQSVKKETSGYFPYPIKIIEGKVILNIGSDEIPLGAEIISINSRKQEQIIPDFYKYYTTDGVNKTGKRIGINGSFSNYYRYSYGLEDVFEVEFKNPKSDAIKTAKVKSVGYSDFKKRFKNRHSLLYDRLQYEDLKENEIYTYSQVDETTGILTINTFGIGGNEKSEEHQVYKKWLDSLFISLKTTHIENLIVDVRNNGGGTDPNDVVTYSYLTSRNFQESKQVWIRFNKIPLLKYYDSSVPGFLRPLGVGRFNRFFQKRFPTERDGKYFIGTETNEMKVRQPNENAFIGNVYLLISPRVASAASLFSALLAGNDNTITIGEESMGGYYGHNGHTSFGYVLPKSKIVTEFSIDNIEQDVPKKSNQFYNRGIMPDYNVPQTFDDFMNNKDTQLEFVMKLIKKKP